MVAYLAEMGKTDPTGVAPHFFKDVCQVCHKTLISILILFVKSGLTTLVRPTMRLEGIVPHDPDHRILECALAAHAEFLVTGNTKHFRRELPLERCPVLL